MSKSIDYGVVVRLQLYSVLVSIGVIYCDCNHYTMYYRCVYSRTSDKGHSILKTQ